MTNKVGANAHTVYIHAFWPLLVTPTIFELATTHHKGVGQEQQQLMPLKDKKRDEVPLLLWRQ